MVVCPVCGHVNMYGVLVCARCFTLLSASSRDSDGSDTPQWQTTGNVPEEFRTARRAARRFSPVAPNTIALVIGDHDAPLVIEVRNQVLLGRHTPGGTSQPDIDLSPYRAFVKGVSRLHAVIHRMEHCLSIEDLGSTNGSWLNNIRLIPFAARPLQPGDLILLSQLQITVYFS